METGSEEDNRPSFTGQRGALHGCKALSGGSGF